MFKKGDIIEHNQSGNLKKVVTNLLKGSIKYYDVVNVFRPNFSYDKKMFTV